jgi:hypothetical protein
MDLSNAAQLREAADYAQRNGALETASYLRRVADLVGDRQDVDALAVPGALESLVADLIAAIEGKQAAEAERDALRAAWAAVLGDRPTTTTTTK